ncbi:hypothetical protein BKA80DRAFT_284179 [Phyllosticta citrichinensis]
MQTPYVLLACATISTSTIGPQLAARSQALEAQTRTDKDSLLARVSLLAPKPSERHRKQMEQVKSTGKTTHDPKLSQLRRPTLLPETSISSRSLFRRVAKTRRRCGARPSQNANSWIPRPKMKGHRRFWKEADVSKASSALLRFPRDNHPCEPHRIDRSACATARLHVRCMHEKKKKKNIDSQQCNPSLEGDSTCRC